MATNDTTNHSKKNTKKNAHKASNSSANMKAVRLPAPPMLPETAAQRAERLAEELELARADARAEEEQSRAALVAREAEQNAAMTTVPALEFMRLRDQVVQLTAQLEQLGMRTDLPGEDDPGIEETYDGTGMNERLDEILQLADKMGAITADDVSKHVLGRDGKKWYGNPVRVQLRKLVRQGKLVMRSSQIPAGVGRHRKPCDVWARTDARMNAFLRSLEERRAARA